MKQATRGRISTSKKLVLRCCRINPAVKLNTNQGFLPLSFNVQLKVFINTPLSDTHPTSRGRLKQYLSLFDLLGQVLFGLVGGVQLHLEVVHHPLRLLALQLYPLSQLDLLLQCLLLVDQLTRDLHTHAWILNICQRFKSAQTKPSRYISPVIKSV